MIFLLTFRESDPIPETLGPRNTKGPCSVNPATEEERPFAVFRRLQILDVNAGLVTSPTIPRAWADIRWSYHTPWPTTFQLVANLTLRITIASHFADMD